MTREEFMKKRWKPFEEIIYTNKRTGSTVSCMLLAVDFECEIMKLEPFETMGFTYSRTNEFWSPIEFLKRPSPKLKINK